MFVHTLQVRFLGVAALAFGGLVVMAFQSVVAAGDSEQAKPMVLYRFRGNGKDSSGNGHDLTIENAKWHTVAGRKHGLEFSGDCATKAFLSDPLAELDFGTDDFTIFVDVQLKENPDYGSWTIMETYNGPTGPGISLELTNLNNGKLRWQFHLNDNGTAFYDGDAAAMQKRTRLHIVREKGQVSIFADGELKFGPKAMPNAPDKTAPLHFGYRAGPQKHCCLGTLWTAGVWRSALDNEGVASLVADDKE